MSHEDYFHALSTADRLKRYISALLNDRDNLIKHLEAENNDLKQMLEEYKDSIGTLEDGNERLSALESAVREMLDAGEWRLYVKPSPVEFYEPLDNKGSKLIKAVRDKLSR